MFGRERDQPGVLIELEPRYAIDVSDEQEVIKARNLVWSVFFLSPLYLVESEMDGSGQSWKKPTKSLLLSVDFIRNSFSLCRKTNRCLELVKARSCARPL